MNVKNSILVEKKREVVYEVPKKCHLSYIGDTKRTPRIYKNWGAQAGSETGGAKEWHSSSCPPFLTCHQLGRCQSEEKCEWILELPKQSTSN